MFPYDLRIKRNVSVRVKPRVREIWKCLLFELCKEKSKGTIKNPISIR